MKLRIVTTVACIIAVCVFAGTPRTMADDDDAGIHYTLDSSAHHVRLGQSPGLRLSVTNSTGSPVSHVLEPAAYEVTIDGPEGHSVWFFLVHIMPTDLRLQIGQTTYLFGGATTYQYPDSSYFERAGTYHVKYCDRWVINGHDKRICSKSLEVHVGDTDADRDGN